jgi:hypothetical protein
MSTPVLALFGISCIVSSFAHAGTWAYVCRNDSGQVSSASFGNFAKTNLKPVLLTHRLRRALAFTRAAESILPEGAQLAGARSSAGCDSEPVARFIPSGVLLIDGEIDRALSAGEREAVRTHQALLKLQRVSEGREDAAAADKILASLYAGKGDSLLNQLGSANFNTESEGQALALEMAQFSIGGGRLECAAEGSPLAEGFSLAVRQDALQGYQLSLVNSSEDGPLWESRPIISNTAKEFVFGEYDDGSHEVRVARTELEKLASGKIPLLKAEFIDEWNGNELKSKIRCVLRPE